MTDERLKKMLLLLLKLKQEKTGSMKRKKDNSFTYVCMNEWMNVKVRITSSS